MDCDGFRLVEGTPPSQARHVRLVAVIGVCVPAIAQADPVRVAVAAVADTVAKATAQIDPKALAGPSIVIATIDKPSADAAKTVREALAARAFTIVDELASPPVLTVEAPSHARATIVLDPERGAITVIAKPANVKAPGKCVAIPQQRHEVYLHSMAVNQDGELGQGTVHWDLRTTAMLDVDGDGVLDDFVPTAPSKHACPEQVRWRVFARRGTCGHDVGIVGPGWVTAATTADASGFFRLTSSAESSALGKDAVPQMTTSTRTFAVQNGRYVQIDQSTRTGLCHHCATWSCTAP